MKQFQWTYANADVFAIHADMSGWNCMLQNGWVDTESLVYACCPDTDIGFASLMGECIGYIGKHLYLEASKDA